MLVVKLNESFAGEGNALLDLGNVISQAERDQLSGTSLADRESYLQSVTEKIMKAFEQMQFQSAIEKWDSFRRKITSLGALAEVFIDGNNKTSPSGQACITGNGQVLILSTHEQVLGGASKQMYLGCSFPAHQDYKIKVQEYTTKGN